MIDFIFISIGAFIGGLLYRLRGSERYHISKPLEAALFCLILLLPLGVLSPVAAGLSFLLTWAMSLRGHGTSMDLGTWKKPVEPEWYEYAFGLLKLKNKLSPYWYDALGLAISGFVVTFFPGFALVAAGHLWGFALMLIGAVKAPAYMIGWKMHPTGDDGLSLPLLRSATEWGEFLFGFFVWFFVLMIWGF